MVMNIAAFLITLIAGFWAGSLPSRPLSEPATRVLEYKIGVLIRAYAAVQTLQARPDFTVAGAYTNTEVIELLRNFKRSVETGDKELAASLMNFPLRVSFPDEPIGKRDHYLNRKSFIRNFDRLFNDRLKRFIARIDVDDAEQFIVRYDGIGSNQGEFWIGVFCYDEKCTDNRSYTRIRTIWGNSIFLDESRVVDGSN